MQQMADRNPYFNILAPKVAGNLSTAAYDSLFQTFKVIYPDYASCHFVSDLKTLVMDTILQRWSIHLQPTDFYMMIDTDQGTQMLDDLPHSILDVLENSSTLGRLHFSSVVASFIDISFGSERHWSFGANSNYSSRASLLRTNEIIYTLSWRNFKARRKKFTCLTSLSMFHDGLWYYSFVTITSLLPIAYMNLRILALEPLIS
jgi:hypothetical protein